MNLSQLKAAGYKVFNRQKNENKEANIAALQYIESIAVRTNTNISSWNLLEIFGGEGRREYDLLKDKNEINKIFFAKEAELREDGDANIQQIKSMVSARVQEITQATRLRRASELERLYTSHMTYAEQYTSKVQAELKAAHHTWKQVMELRDGSLNLENEVVGVLREKFWKYRDFSGAAILYETNSDIILTDINPAAGLDMRVNLGKFVAEVTLETCAVRIYPMKTFEPHPANIGKSGYYHPHISNEGSICWGNVKTRALAFQSQGKLTELMNLLASLMSSYSNENPYVALADFYKIQTDREKKANVQTQAGQTQGIVGGQVAPNFAGPLPDWIAPGSVFGRTITTGTTGANAFDGLIARGTELNLESLEEVRRDLNRDIFAEQIGGNWTVTLRSQAEQERAEVDRRYAATITSGVGGSTGRLDPNDRINPDLGHFVNELHDRLRNAVGEQAVAEQSIVIPPPEPESDGTEGEESSEPEYDDYDPEF